MQGEKDLRVLLPFCVVGYAIAAPRYREWLVMQLPPRDTGSSAGRAPAQIGT